MSVPNRYKVPYGKNSIEFDLPSSMECKIAVSKPTKPLIDPLSAIKQSLQSPLGAPRLEELCHPGQRVCILFSDVTRSSPDHMLVPAVLEALKHCGVRDDDITLLCATGMHRKSTQAEKISKIGQDAFKRFRVIDNEAQNPSLQIDLGTTSSGVPVQIHRAVVEADLVIATGIVEPHQYAGYSGGRKTVAIGAAGEKTIQHTHGPHFVDHPGTRLGRIDGNPFHEAVIEAADMAGLHFIINVVLDSKKRILRVAAGEPNQAFHHLVQFARSVYETPIPQQYDIAIGGVGYPKDSNLYQASRAPTYLFFAPTPVVKPGGFFIIPARCEEGAGDGVGEQRFLRALRDALDINAILDDARRFGYPPGEQRAFVLAKVLEKNEIIIVGSEYPDLVSECKMIPAATMNEALQLTAHSLGNDCQVLIVPHAMLTLPVVQA